MAVTTDTRMAQALLARLEADGKLDEALRYETLDGELVIRGSPRLDHEDAVNALMDHLRAWVRQHGGGVYTRAGVEVGGHQLGPDVAFIGPDRVGDVDVDGFRVAPDLVAEVASPGTRSIDLVEKQAIYQRIGVAEYWVVDLGESRGLVRRRGATGAYESTPHTDGVVTTVLAPGVAVPVAELLGPPPA